MRRRTATITERNERNLKDWDRGILVVAMRGAEILREVYRESVEDVQNAKAMVAIPDQKDPPNQLV